MSGTEDENLDDKPLTLSDVEREAPAIPDVDFDDTDEHLTDEERAAIAELEKLGEDGEREQALAAGKGDDEDEEGDEDEDEGDDGAATAAADDTAKADPAPQDAPAPAAAEDDPEIEKALASLGKAPEWTEAQANRLKELGDKEALEEKFEEGELTSKDFANQVAELAKLEAAQQAVNDWSARAKDVGDRLWDSALSRFQAANPGLFKGFDEGAAEADRKASTAFDEIVQKFTASDLAVGMKFSEALEECKAIMARRYPDLMPAAEAPPLAKGKGGKAKVEARTDARPAPPRTLAHVPADGVEGESRFAAVDNLARTNPLAMEKAVQRMSDADEERWLLEADPISARRAGRR